MPQWEPDAKRRVEEPFNLNTWLDNNVSAIQTSGSVKLFDNNLYQSDVFVHGFGDHGKSFVSGGKAETFLWVLRGGASVDVDGKKFDIMTDDTLLIPGDSKYSFTVTDKNTAILSCHMDARNRSRVGF